MKKAKGYTSIHLLFIFLFLFICVSWIKNLLMLIDCDFEAPYKAEVVHTIGLIPPAAMVTAWIDIDDTPKGKEGDN
jgi:hypothetical protein